MVILWDILLESIGQTEPVLESIASLRKAKLHMARALIMNPEILILEKPLMNVDERESWMALGSTACGFKRTLHESIRELLSEKNRVVIEL